MIKEKQDLTKLLWSAEKINIIGVLTFSSSQDTTLGKKPISIGTDGSINVMLSKSGTYFMRIWKKKNSTSIQEACVVSLVINGRKIKDIVFANEEFVDCYISWSQLKRGKNIIFFRARISGTLITPNKFFDSIEIGFIVNSLAKYLAKEKFKKFAKVNTRQLLNVKGGIAQKQDSYLNYYFRVFSGMSLRLGYRLTNFGSDYAWSTSCLSVGLTDKNGHFEKLLKVNSERASPKSISLEQYNGQIVRLTFRFVTAKKDFSPNSQVIWIEPAILASSAKEELIPEEKAQLPAISEKQKNIFWIVLDALNAKHLSCYGYPYKTTPNIDVVASEGIQFNHAYTQGVNTNISVASMFTSLYPESTKVWGYKTQLQDKADTVVEIIEKQKIKTTIISDHIGLELSNLTQGFKEKIFLEGNVLKGRSSFYKKILTYFKNLLPSASGHFIYIHFLSPHSPYQPPEPYCSMFDKDYQGNIKGTQKTLIDINKQKILVTERDIRHLRALYDGNLNYIDHILGEIFKAIKSNGIYDNSLIIITSDHGEGLMEHGYLFHNQYVYEESIHVPLILKFPKSYNLIQKKIETIVELIDLYPTILDYLGIWYQQNLIQGKSLVPLIKSMPGYSKQMIYSRGHGELFSFSSRFGNYKYIYHAPKVSEELYDISQDLEEKNNLVATHTNLVGYYKMKVLQWILQQWDSYQGFGLPKKYSKKQLESLKALGYLR